MNLDEFIARHRLPPEFTQTATEYFAPLAQWVATRRAAFGKPGFILGLNGAQGTGKSTLSNYLAETLAADYGHRVAELSIDDIYLTRDERTSLAEQIHPLLATRGVPGTHDVELGSGVLDELRTLKPGAWMPLPRFDKAVDDRAPMDLWPTVTGPVDVIIFEGWCIGSESQSAETLRTPINPLEADEDAAGTWRKYVNNALATDYQAMFKRLDALVYLAAPDLAAVLRWRREQEQKLRDRAGDAASAVLDDAAVERFVQHFERLTRHNFEQLPRRADALVTLGADHRAKALTLS